MTYAHDIFCPVSPCVYRSHRGAQPGRSGRVRHGAAALAAGHCRAATATPATGGEPRDRLPALRQDRPGGQGGGRRRTRARGRDPGGPPRQDRVPQGLRPVRPDAPVPAHEGGHHLRYRLSDQGRGHHHRGHGTGGSRPNPVSTNPRPPIGRPLPPTARGGSPSGSS